MRISTNATSKLLKYDLLIFFREPFYALPILLLPGLFFILYASSMININKNIAGFAVYIPMYMLLIVFLTLFFNIGTQYVTDKQIGIFKRMMLTPIDIYNIVFTYALRGILISILGFIEMILIAKFGFNIPLSEHMITFFFVYLVCVMIMLLISLSIHGFFNNVRQVMPISIVGFQYVLFASGMIMPVDLMPVFLKILIYINPVYHMNQILVKVWFGKPIDSINVLALAGFTLLCFILFKIQKGLKADK